MGPIGVTVLAAVGAYASSQFFTWNVGSPITITAPGDQTSTEGSTVSLSISATDSLSGSTLVYSATGLPAGLAIAPSSGAITGTVGLGAAVNGPYTVTVVAGDGTYSGSQTFTWNVNSPISLTIPADQTNNEGDTVSLSLSATDSISGATLRYAAQGLPTGLVISPTSGAITGTIAPGASANGPYSVTIAAEDGTYTNTQIFNWNVNSAVTLTAPADQTNNAGDTVSLAISATDAISGATLSYTATGLPNGLTINSSTGAITGTLSDGGAWQPTVTASDGTYSNAQTFNWTVNSPITITDPGGQANNPSDTVSLQVSAVDTASGTLSFAATGLPTGLSIDSSTGLISGTITASAGSFTTTVTVSDGTNSAVDTFGWSVGVVTFTSPGNQTNNAGDRVSLQISANDSALALSSTAPRDCPRACLSARPPA